MSKLIYIILYELLILSLRSTTTHHNLGNSNSSLIMSINDYGYECIQELLKKTLIK